MVTTHMLEKRQSLYEGFHKWGYPQSSSILMGFSLNQTIKFGGTPMTSWKPPYDISPVEKPLAAWDAPPSRHELVVRLLTTCL